ncbi:MAG: alginate lyase family protein, partial [Syntrophothermus sp.]
VTKSIVRICIVFCFLSGHILSQAEIPSDILKREKEKVLNESEKYLSEDPVTITAFRAERSAGGIHDYYSEGTYWWPDPQNPSGPYVRRDGINNPDNFVKHSNALERFSIQTAALAAAFRLTGDERYSRHAMKHLKAWFADEATRMNPNLLYAQAIKGVVTGRGIGIIDAIHLIEVARSVQVLEGSGAIAAEDLTVIKAWFSDFLTWMTTHKYGIDEMNNGNNHSTWWCAQAAMYASLTGNSDKSKFCLNFAKTELIPKQIDTAGSFPQELARTKPYSYSLFNFEGFALICRLASMNGVNLWEYKASDGQSIKKAAEFIFPFIADKSKWKYKKDIVNFDKLPVRIMGLLSAGIDLKRQEYIDIWAGLNPDLENDEMVRTFAIRQPVLWIDLK